MYITYIDVFYQRDTFYSFLHFGHFEAGVGGVADCCRVDITASELLTGHFCSASLCTIPHFHLSALSKHSCLFWVPPPPQSSLGPLLSCAIKCGWRVRLMQRWSINGRHRNFSLKEGPFGTEHTHKFTQELSNVILVLQGLWTAEAQHIPHTNSPVKFTRNRREQQKFSFPACWVFKKKKCMRPHWQ